MSVPKSHYGPWCVDGFVFFSDFESCKWPLLGPADYNINIVTRDLSAAIFLRGISSLAENEKIRELNC